MPTYEYRCQSCGETFEKFQSITARPLRRCPLCGRGKVRRLIGAGAGVLFRGSGFHETDYRSDEYKRKAKTEQKPGGDSSKSDSADQGAASKESAGKNASKAKE